MDHQQWQNRINEISGDLESRLDPAAQNFAKGSSRLLKGIFQPIEKPQLS